MAGRAVMLTTHSMEECEALCSRIGIMVSGRLRCLGSAHHLKQRFGQGYQLDVTIGFAKQEEKARNQAQAVDVAAQAQNEDGESVPIRVVRPSNAGGGEIEMQTQQGEPKVAEWQEDPNLPAVRIDSFVLEPHEEKDVLANTQLLSRVVENFQKFVAANFPGSKLLEAHSNRLKFRVPSNVMSLGSLFTTIEKYRDKLHIEEYSVSQTTLEQIFVHFAKQQDEEKGPVAGLSP